MVVYGHIYRIVIAYLCLLVRVAILRYWNDCVPSKIASPPRRKTTSYDTLFSYCILAITATAP